MKITKQRTGLPTAAIAAILALAGCADENPWGTATNETGDITISLITDNDFKTSRPVFRSSDDDTRAASGDLSDYITVPSPENFSIRLEKNDGSYAPKTWTSVEAFRQEASSTHFPTGAYTITAYYGEKGKQDFESPYYEGTASFTVLSGQTSEVNLTAELKNSMVKINYSDSFKDYMQDYETHLRTEGRADAIVFGPVQTKPAFIEPASAQLTVAFTTKDKGYQSSVTLGQFAPEAKTLHNITFDIGENQNGDATLKVNFDDSLEEDNVEIDLTEELLTTPIPVITCEGFMDGQTIDMLEGSGSDTKLKMSIFAEGGIQSAVMTVESNVAYKPEWGYEIDLCTADTDQQGMLSASGIKATGLYKESKPDQMAFLDLTDYGKSLKNGVYTISLQVTDKNGVVSKATKVTLNSLPITVNLIGEPTIVYNSGQAVLTFDYNGLNPTNEITFTAEDDFGNDVETQIISCEEAIETRAFETKRYIFTIKLPNTTKSSIKITAYHNQKPIATYPVPVVIPVYRISAIDAFSRYAYLKIITPESTDPSVLAAVTNNLQIQSTNVKIEKRDAANGILTINGLTPGNTYNLESSITGGDTWQSESSFIAEQELSIPNGDFSQSGHTLTSGDLQVGGEYRVSPTDYKHKSSFSVELPSNWATINELTAWSGANPRNTWFVVPSSWLHDGQGFLRNVGYNHNGTVPSKSGGAFNTKYYCENSPSADQLVHAAGEMFLGTYSFNGSETRKDGIAFASRPSSISFDYSYTLKNGNADNGYAHAEVVDADGMTIGSSEPFAIPTGTGSKTITFNYQKFGGKAAFLKVCFKSSNQVTPPIHIPTGGELNEGQGLGSKTISSNNYHAVATGSELLIDNVTANYTATGTANAAKRKNTTKKR